LTKTAKGRLIGLVGAVLGDRDESADQLPDSSAATNGAPKDSVAKTVDATGVLGKKYKASFWSDGELPKDFAEAVLALEAALAMPVFMLVQNGLSETESDGGHDLRSFTERQFLRARDQFPANTPVAVLLESPGGYASSAFRIAKMLQRRCGSFKVVVVNWAKSAATLLSLGASEIIFGDNAQLGPIDAQIFDPHREEMTSALSEAQSFLRLHAAALDVIDRTTILLVNRTGKRIDSILPHTLKFVAETMRPLLEKVDVVQFTDRLRTLKVAEEYAARLLRPNHAPDAASTMARHLVDQYPDHGFVIDFDEAQKVGLNVKQPDPNVRLILDRLLVDIESVNALGRVEHV
jgi:hypothetical protein